MFVTRLISGIVLVMIALATVIAGNDILLATLFAVSVIGMYELYRILHMEKTAAAAAGYVAAAIYYLALHFTSAYAMPILLGFFIVLMGIYVFTFPKYKSEQVFLVFFGMVYVAVMLACLYQTRQMKAGAYIVWLIFLCSWGSDTCAYCVGMLTGKFFGNHKMTPKLSPKKSIEGAVGGVVGAALLGIIYAYVFYEHFEGISNPVLACGVLCAAGALISMIGDLAASAIKRNFEVKDYGTLIPGHGGIMDRFDSVIFTAPIIYYLAVYLLPVLE